MFLRRLLAASLFLGVSVLADSAQATEMGALLQVRSLNTAEVNYYSQFGRYAKNLAELGPPSKGSASSEAAADLIPADLASGVRNGYRFTLTASTNGYSVHADPLKYPDTGGRSFFSEETLVIRQNRGAAPATAASPEVE